VNSKSVSFEQRSQAVVTEINNFGQMLVL